MKTMHHAAAAVDPEVTPRLDEDRVVEEHRALVVRLARALARRSGPGVEVDDLVGAGLLGVVRATRSFDPTVGVPFVLFVARHARWAMLTEVRATRPLRRGASDRRRELRGAEERLAHRLHHAPTRHDLALELAAPAAVVARWQAEVAAAERVSDAVDGSGISHLPDEGPLPEDVVLALELTAALHQAIEDLPARLAHVVRTTFFEGRRLADVAAELGVTESRVSQLRTEAVGLLRHRLEWHDRSA